MFLAAVVVASVILSPEVERTQELFKAIELVVSPNDFPDLTIGVEPVTEQTVTATVNNPVGNPAVNVTVSVSLVSAGCSLGTVTIETTDLCLGPWTSAPVPLSPGAGTVFTMVLTYSNSFVGSAEFTFQATGTN